MDENTRKSLFKLRSTWDDVFPLKKLYSLDVRVNSLDPAWPIKPLPPTVNASIHVNPKFLKQVCMCCRDITSGCDSFVLLLNFKTFVNQLLELWTEVEKLQ